MDILRGYFSAPEQSIGTSYFPPKNSSVATQADRELEIQRFNY
jgi:hypothetical protein